MHHESMAPFRHEHVFLGTEHQRNERRTWAVIVLCGGMMVAEIAGGLLFGSMALIADGLHMTTHTAALLIAALAYSFARRHARDDRFAFGTGKFGDLAGFGSAIVLAMIALLIGWESITRLLHPVAIAFDEAIPIAAVGLGINLLSAWLLRDDPHHNDSVGRHHEHQNRHPEHRHHEHRHHDHHHGNYHRHEHHEHAAHGHDTDLNLRAAYVHVLADAAVSVLAVMGLLAAREFGLLWIDPLMGIFGAGVIANWSVGLIKAAGAVLLDMRTPDLAEAVRQRLEVEGDRLADLHLWRIGPGHIAAIVSVVADNPKSPALYKARLAGLAGLSHVTIEVQACPGHA